MQIFRKEKGIPEPVEEEKKPAPEEKQDESSDKADEPDDKTEEITADGDVTAEDAAKGIDETAPDTCPEDSESSGPDIGIFSNHSI